MNRSEKKGVCIGLTMTFSFVLGAVAIELAKHSWFAYGLLLPFAVLQGFVIHSDALFWCLSIVQFPLYGFFISWAWLKSRIKLAIWVILILHLIAVGVMLPFFLKGDFRTI